jgi:hypothetical protein
MMWKGTLAHLGAAVLTCLGLSGCIYYFNPLCNDQIRNGDETDIDCGGTCGVCNVGDSCHTNTDCDNDNCVRGTCTALPCENGKQDEQETDVDCGGGTCRKCSGGRTCRVGTDCFSGMCLAGSNTCASLAQVSFADRVSYPSGDKTYALFAGDLDGDGRVDLAAANEQGNSVSVFLSNGDGSFRTLASQNTAFRTGDFPTGGAIADFNHDGVADVITANYHGNSVGVLLGKGMRTGALSAGTTYATVDGGETSNLAVGDLDGDGNLDAIATNPSSIVLMPSVSQFMGRADGTFASAINIPIGAGGFAEPYSAAIGDFNGDGKNDLAIADNHRRMILVRLGNGDGTFQPESLYDEGGDGSYILITHDMDLDGKLDLVCANRASNDVSVLLGRGDGTFKKAIVTSTGAGFGLGPYSIAVADFNLDGVPDVVTANFMSNNASVLLGIGNGAFEPAIDAGPTGDHSYGVAVGDFDGDGHPDFATANASDNNVTVKRNTSR